MEIWREIKGFDYPYEVSSIGRVKNTDYRRTGKERILSGSVNNGYLKVRLRQNGEGRIISIHALVAEVFLGYHRDGKMTEVVNHIDENKINNNVLNLEVVSNRQNIVHSLTKRKKNGLPANIRMSGLKYEIQIGHGQLGKTKEGKGCKIYLGAHKTLEEAIAVRDKYYHELENCKFKHLEIL